LIDLVNQRRLILTVLREGDDAYQKYTNEKGTRYRVPSTLTY
jgi:hypothetical protein